MNLKIYLTRKDAANLLETIEKLTKEQKELEAQTSHFLLQGQRNHDKFPYIQLVAQLQCRATRLEESCRILHEAEVVDPPSSTERVILGTQVTILRDDVPQVWEIVGYGQSDADQHFLAYNTQLGSLLIGRKVEDDFIGMIATKSVHIRIISITMVGTDENLGLGRVAGVQPHSLVGANRN